ncbi:MAG: cell division protein FtsL [Gemmatimonadaceae bacterium]|jgi:cell division protein FtsL|nr:cell division protein FtsL [Gemmatimonadaceae bacterium]
MATRSVNRQRRGRTLVFLLLVGFVAVTGGIIARRASGRALQKEYEGLALARTQLTGEAAKLDAELRVLGSRSRLAPLVEQRLGMRVPADSQVIDLPMPEGARGAP